MAWESIDIKYLKGVGEGRGKALAKELDIHTFRDLAYFFPSRHIDRSRFYRIRDLAEDFPHVQVKGRFISFRIEGEGKASRLVGLFHDGDTMMEILWFQKVKQIRESYQIGVDYVIFGKPKNYRGVINMAHPEIERYDATRPPEGLRGIYPVGESAKKSSLTSRIIHTLVCNLLENKNFLTIPETLPEEIMKGMGLMSLRDAIKEMHNPSSAATLAKATERFKFEELFYLELHILRYARTRNEKYAGYPFARIGESFNRFYNEVLPFQLTGAQKRVLKEIREDMRFGKQMNRLLQGDVGCGKTMVAFMTMLMAIDNGCQACIMAPTEILATQHYEGMKEWCDKLGLDIRLLTGSTRTKQRRLIHEALEDGSLNILVGTHALIEEKVKFHKLGVAVVDEQHRFGVAQRAKLWQKGPIAPHVLIMTATPIPRTLAMTVYGDLEVSVIDELPPGRKPVATYLRYVERRAEVNRLVYRQLMEGRQIYFVYPLVHENEKLDLKSLEEGYEQVQETFPEYRTCFVHGQMKPDEKDYQMNLFVTGKAQIMVATTVIEVGVNVPNASVMIIENAERFGLSQLHQLRGRVGRGADQSFCILMAKENMSRDTRKRLNIMTETNDGFIVSEADMNMRGPGDMEGTQQSGFPISLKVASLSRDGQMISVAREKARLFLEGNPLLTPLTLFELDYRFAGDTDYSKIS